MLMTLGKGVYNEVCFAHFILRGGGCTPRKFLNFRPSEITSGAFSSIVLLCCAVLHLLLN